MRTALARALSADDVNQLGRETRQSESPCAGCSRGSVDPVLALPAFRDKAIRILLGWIAAQLRDLAIVPEAMAAFHASVAALTDKKPRRGQDNHRYRRLASYFLALDRDDLAR